MKKTNKAAETFKNNIFINNIVHHLIDLVDDDSITENEIDNIPILVKALIQNEKLYKMITTPKELSAIRDHGKCEICGYPMLENEPHWFCRP